MELAQLPLAESTSPIDAYFTYFVRYNLTMIPPVIIKRQL